MTTRSERLRRFLLFGTELNVIHCPLKSSLNNLLTICPQLKSNFKPESKELLLLSQTPEEGDEAEEHVFREIQDIVREANDNLWPLSLPILVQCLLMSKREEFRQISLKLIPLLNSHRFLQLICLLEKKNINSSKRVRKALTKWYTTRDFTEANTEEALIFARVKEWCHKDVIRLLHVKPNTTSALLCGKQSEAVPTQDTPAGRVHALRCEKTRPHQLVPCLDKCHIAPDLWFRAVNSRHLRSQFFWGKLVSRANTLQLVLKLVPRVVTRYPNKKRLFEEMALKMRSLAATSETGNELLMEIVMDFLQKNVLKVEETLLKCLKRELNAIIGRKTGSADFVLIQNLNFDKTLLEPKNVKRKRKDYLDLLTMKDIILLVLRAFDPLILTENQAINRFSELSADFVANCNAIPINDKRVEDKNVLFLTESEVDLNLLPKNSFRKLIVAHPIKREVKGCSGGFRSDAIIINGFDIRWQTIIQSFFQ